MKARRAAWTTTGSVAGVVLLLGGCAGVTPQAGRAPDGRVARGDAAEVVDSADCAVQEAVAGLGVGGGQGLPAAPRAGAVPDGFVPVAAVECRPGALVLVTGSAPVLVPELGGPALPGVADDGPTVPRRTVEVPLPTGAVEDARTAPDPWATEPSEPTSPVVRIDAVRLEGDLGPLLAQLRRPDETPRSDQACPAMFEAVPALYLVDTDDRAVRVTWPTDACGFRHDGAAESVAALTEVDRDELTLP
ncbi:hypothetical protein [Cellulomonas iranensis]|uniref:hypothetical protein n=1 Tax=Cellulomonas iranensis TaxID=76862 RepID=UPI00117749E8|nr:hypothetical protein [Cellulomonas iranensis]